MEAMKELQYHCQRIHNHKASLNVHQKESTISIPLNLKLNLLQRYNNGEYHNLNNHHKRNTTVSLEGIHMSVLAQL